jgi:opacity protein-like surface antigen
MKFSLISLIALALTSTSVMAAAQPVAVEKRAFDTNDGTMTADVPKGRKNPRLDAANPKITGWYRNFDAITIVCSTTKDTDGVAGFRPGFFDL